MATYIPGITDYVPQIQPFQPDYNFLSNILQTRQSRYDSAHKQLSGVYGTLLSSPMLRDENIAKREGFFKMINQDIQKMSGMDLSLQQNVDQAMQIFKPFYEDKNMVKDMVWTKQLYKQMERGENFRTCVDPDKCGGQYWEGGIQALQWKAQEFKNASTDEALSFANPNFTPYVNVTDKAMKAAKEAGFGVKFDEVRGGYIVTTKNGDRMISPLSSFFTSKFGSDPNVTAYYKTQAYLERKNWVANNVSAYGDEGTATAAYMTQMMGHTQQAIGNKKIQAEQEQQISSERRKSYENIIRKDGILMSDTEMIDGYVEVLNADEEATLNHEYYKNADNISGNISQNAGNYGVVADKFDELVGLNKLSNEMIHAASMYANLTMEQTIKADPYALASHTSSLQLKNMMAGKAADFEYWKMKKEYDVQKEQEKWDAFLGPDKATPIPNAPGTGTREEANVSLKENREKLNELYNGANGDKMNYVRTMIDAIEQHSKGKGNYATSLDNLYQVFKSAGLKNAHALASNVLKGGEERVDALNQLSRVNIKSLNNVYDTALTLSDPSKPVWGTLNRSWSKPFWDKTANERAAVSNKKQIYDAAAEWSSNQTKDLTSKVAGQYRSKGDNRSASLAEYMATQTHNGIFPNSDEWRMRVAQKWAQQHQDEFSATTGGGMSGQALMTEDRSTGNFLGKEGDSFVISGPITPSEGSFNQANYKSRYDKALEWAMTNIKDVKSAIETRYLEEGSSWHHDDMFGKGTTGHMSMAYEVNFDPANVQRKGTLTAAELFRNYSSAQGEAKVEFGNATQLPEESNEKAQAVVNQMMTDFFSSPGKMIQNRPNGRVVFQRVAGHDANTWAFTMYPSEAWVKKYKGSAKAPGLTAELTPGSGVTVFLPHSAANNSMFAATEYDDYDFLLDKNGFMQIGDYSDAGNLELSKVGNQYAVRGYVNGLNPDGTVSKIEVNKTYNSDIRPSVVYNDWVQKLGNLQQFIQDEKQALRQSSGVKDPSQLINAPME